MSEYKSGKALGSVLEGAVEVMRDRATGVRRPVPMRLFGAPGGRRGPVPWREAEDDLGGGLWPGFWILVGGTGTGKTQLALSLALGAALEGCPVAYIGLELGDVDLVARLLGLLSGLSWSGLYLGKKIDRKEQPGALIDDEQVREASEALRDLPFLTVQGDPMGWGPDRLKDVVKDLERLAEERGINTETHPPFVVLDFLQLVGDPATAERPLDVRNRIQLASYQARAMARDHGVAILAVSSTSRENATKLQADEGLPPMSSLVGTGKESGEIEYSADGVFVLVQHPFNEIGERAVSVARAKLRAGRTGYWHLRFNGWRHRTSTSSEAASAQRNVEVSEASRLVELGLNDSKARIANCDNIERLRDAHAIEKKKKNRVKVLGFIENRIAELEAERVQSAPVQADEDDGMGRLD